MRRFFFPSTTGIYNVSDSEMSGSKPGCLRIISLTPGLWLHYYIALTEFDKMCRRVYIYGAVNGILSLFFIGWSLSSFFSTGALVSLYGLLFFASAALMSCLLMSKNYMLNHPCARINLVLTNVANMGFFVVMGLYYYEHGYNMSLLITTAAFLGIYLILTPLGVYLLTNVQRVRDKRQISSSSSDGNPGKSISTGSGSSVIYCIDTRQDEFIPSQGSTVGAEEEIDKTTHKSEKLSVAENRTVEESPTRDVESPMIAVESFQTQLDHARCHNSSEILGVEIDENQYICIMHRA